VSIIGRLLSKSAINTTSSNLKMLRVMIADETGSVQGLAFDSMAEKLDPELKVQILIMHYRTIPYLVVV
jgi:hypothetical protein